MSVTGTELWRMSAVELAEAIRSRQVSSQEVIGAHLRRIEAVNPSVNAVTVVLGEQALDAAKAADRAAAGGGDLPPLHGVPFTVKGNIDLAGTPTTQGLKAFAGAYPTRDSPHVERLKGSWGDPDRAHQPGQLRGPLALCQRAVGCDRQPVGPVPHPRRLQRRRRGGAGDRHDAAESRGRWARIAALAGPMLRDQHAEAHPGTYPRCDHHPARRCADHRSRDLRRRSRAGLPAAVSLGSRREERQMSVNREAPDRLTNAARLLTGLHVSHPSTTDAASRMLVSRGVAPADGRRCIECHRAVRDVSRSR